MNLAPLPPPSNLSVTAKYRSIGAAVLAALMAVVGLGIGAMAPTEAASAVRPVTVEPAIVSDRHLPDFPRTASSVPTYRECRAAKLVCYDPKQVRAMYEIKRLIAAGHTGKGQTIVIVDAYGSPTLRTDLKAFDKAFHLIAPPSLRILHPYGTPKYHESSFDESGWAAETSLDVEWAHAIAPSARIDLLESKNDNNVFSDFYRLETYAFKHHLGRLLTQSWGTAEENLTRTAGGRRIVNDFESLYRKMDRAHWTVFAATGDTGSGNSKASGAVYRYATVNYPASSPLLTAVGGTTTHATARGRWVKESVWNDGAGGGAGGGGVSRYFDEPSYQRSVKGRSQALLRHHRGVPDVSWDADPETGIWVRCTAAVSCQSFNRHRDPSFYGWDLAGGTSAGSPQWAGLLADINEAVGHPIGPIDTDLYRMGAGHVGYHDITRGDNTYNRVSGFSARRGWDEASGWGTPGARLASGLIADGKHRR